MHRVLFGFRIRAGFIADEWGVKLDWCGGGDWRNVERLYSLTKAILMNRPENRQCFQGLPTCSKIKPFFLDEEFVRLVGKEAGDFELVTLEKVELNKPRWLST